MADTPPTPLAAALDSVGDRWTLLLVEALLDGPRRFGDLQEALGGIAPNVENEEQGVMEGGDLRLAEVFKPLEWEMDAAAVEVGGEDTSAE